MKVELVDYTSLPLSLHEHIHYQFNLSGITRALLQELVRHDFSLSVESTRYTLNKKLRTEQPFLDASSLTDSMNELALHTPDALTRASKYIKLVGVDPVDVVSLQMLDNIRELVHMNSISADYIKYALGESWLVNLTMTIRYPMLLNMIQLRTSKDALWEFQELANSMLQAIPDEHKPLFQIK